MTEQKGTALTDLNGAGFDVVLSGAINKTTDQAEGKYASNAKGISITIRSGTLWVRPVIGSS